MHHNNTRKAWSRLGNKLVELIKALSIKAPTGLRITNVALSAFSLLIVHAQAADSRNDQQQERREERQADRGPHQNASSPSREVRHDTRSASRNDRLDSRQQQRGVRVQNRSAQQINIRADNARREELRSGNRDVRFENRSSDKAQEQALKSSRIIQRNERRDDIRAQNQFTKRWDNGMDNRRRYQTYRKYKNDWGEQRNYLNSNLRRFNELTALNQLQKQQLENQMQEAYRSYNSSAAVNSYGWDTYSDPQFLDYLQTNKPSLMQSILSGLGMGGNADYLYSPNWNDERSQLARNMSNLHKLSIEGRISPQQERELMNQMRPQFMQYHNNNWNGNVTWSQYSDPGFVDYLNKRQPSILTTVKDYLIR